MKHILNRLVSLTLALAMLLALIPAGVMDASAEDSTNYGKAVATVFVRKNPSQKSDYWFSIPADFVVRLMGKEEPDKDGDHAFKWIKVETRRPDSANSNKYVGWVHSDYFRALTLEEEAAYIAGGSQYVLPGETAKPATDDNYPAGTGATGAITSGGTNLRSGPGKNYPRLDSLERNTVVELVTIPTVIDEDHWYKVLYNNQTGYIQSPYIRVISYGSGVTAQPTAAPTGAVTTPTPAPTPTVEPSDLGYVRLLLTSCHLRVSPEGAYDSNFDWEDQYGLLPVCGNVVKKGKYSWYPVRKDGRKYYVRADCVQYITDIDPTAAPTSAPTSTVPGETTPVVTVTPTPTITPTPVPTRTPVGYVTTVMTGCNLRRKASTVADRLLQIPINVTLPYYSQPVQDPNYKKNNFIWYPVEYNGVAGYLRDDVLQVTGPYTPTPTPTPTQTGSDETPTPTLTPTPAPTDAPLSSDYVITTMGGVNLRRGASSDYDVRFTGVTKNTVMKFSLARKVGNHTWYNVTYRNTSCWVVDTVVRVLTAEEAKKYSGGDDPTAAPTSTGLTPKGYVKTTATDVNLRKKEAGAIIGRIKNSGTVMPYLKDPVVKSGVTWYYVMNSELGLGWVHGSYVSVCDEKGDPIVTPTPTKSGKQEAVYTTLKLGSTGDAVKNLVTELKNQGYYKDEITSSYTSKVELAVCEFQANNGLTVDGIAGSETQHKLFGTVPPGEGDYDNLDITLYPAEKIDWWTGGISTLWAKGANYKVYDVKTGIVWWAHRWSGYYHLDAEPLTAADTARLCRIYGVKDAQEIADKDMWQRRPCLVTIGTRTFACSLYGEPHNEEGNTIKDNNFNGQLCIHFTNSKTSGTKIIDSNHQAAIQYAWENAPNGHK
ncbi:MAG: SH3 domain-containing protein [Clostridia bacterium]|nr:SH3 domain-containing protein [Clostridia bacterium]